MAKKKESCFSAGDMQDAQSDGYKNGLAFGEQTAGKKAVAEYRLRELEHNISYRQFSVKILTNGSYFNLVKTLISTFRDLYRSKLVPKGPKALLAAVITSVELIYLSDEASL
jgi:hypothetical protein